MKNPAAVFFALLSGCRQQMQSVKQRGKRRGIRENAQKQGTHFVKIKRNSVKREKRTCQYFQTVLL